MKALFPCLRAAVFLCAAVGMLVAGGLSAVRAQTSADKVVLHQSYPSKVASFWPNYVAETLGFYAKEGLDVQDVIVDPNVTVSSVIGGSVEVSYADSTQLLLALDKGANLVAVGLGTNKQPYKLMAPAAIKTVADLKGKNIGAASAIDIYTYVLKQILRKAKLDPDKDVNFVIGGGQNQRLSAIISGAIQAGLFSPPSDARLTALGFNTLAFTPDIFPNLTLSVTTVRRDWAQQHPDVLRRMLRAQTEAIKWLNDPANKAQALQILVSETNARPSDATEAYDYYIGKHVWSDACVQPSGLVNVVKIMRITEQLKTITEADVPKFADREWCPR